MTTRRGFLGAILAAGVAPAFVGSGVLMPVKKIIVPEFHLYLTTIEDSVTSYTGSVWIKSSTLGATWQQLTAKITAPDFRAAIDNRGPSVEQLILRANGIHV